MDKIESAQQNSVFIFRRNLAMAILAGCAITIPYYFPLRAEAIDEYQRIDFPNFGDLIFLSVFPVAYILAGIGLWLCRNTFIGRKIPHWISVAVFGSVLLPLTVSTVVSVRDGDFLLFRSAENLLRIAFVNLGLSAYAALFTGLVYYLFSKLKVLK